jgi:glycosyltransferase involved in cell wall biosynthesis
MRLASTLFRPTRMRVGYDVSATSQEKTGCSWYADSLIRAMVEEHPEHEYVLYHHFGAISNPDAERGTKLERANVTHPYLTLTVSEAKAEWNQISQGTIPSGAPDIIQANFFDCPRIETIPVVYVVYDLTFLVCPELLAIRHYFSCLPGLCSALRNASGFIFISEYSKNEFERMFPTWLSKTQIPNRVIPLASRGAPRALMKNPGTESWLTVGTIELRKNHATLIAAHDLYWERSSFRRPLTLVGGKGWLSEDVHQLISTREKEGRLIYTGYVTDDELNRLYASAFALVYSSHYEGFGLPVLEAMERGVPVISSSATSLPEVGGNTVIYFNPGSAEELAEKMIELENDEFFRLKLSTEGKERASLFSWKRVADETLEFHHTVRADWESRRSAAHRKVNS